MLFRRACVAAGTAGLLAVAGCAGTTTIIKEVPAPTPRLSGQAAVRPTPAPSTPSPTQAQPVPQRARTQAQPTPASGSTQSSGYSAANCPPLSQGYGVVNGQCVQMQPGSGQYSQQCVDEYGPDYPYLVGEHCESQP
jgi:hypothetical protein